MKMGYYEYYYYYYKNLINYFYNNINSLWWLRPISILNIFPLLLDSAMIKSEDLKEWKKDLKIRSKK